MELNFLKFRILKASYYVHLKVLIKKLPTFCFITFKGHVAVSITSKTHAHTRVYIYMHGLTFNEVISLIKIKTEE